MQVLAEPLAERRRVAGLDRRDQALVPLDEPRRALPRRADRQRDHAPLPLAQGHGEPGQQVVPAGRDHRLVEGRVVLGVGGQVPLGDGCALPRDQPAQLSGQRLPGRNRAHDDVHGVRLEQQPRVDDRPGLAGRDRDDQRPALGEQP